MSDEATSKGSFTLSESEFLPPATKLGQGNIFRSVCQEFCPQLGDGVSRQQTQGGRWGVWLGGVQAQTQGEAGGLAGGGFRPTRGVVVSRPRARGCIPACTEADTPQQTATAAGSMHPTGMHSCCLRSLSLLNVIIQ